ncbi:MAG: 50S ribosomal protein L9 [Rhizobiales bacterium]|nr:50S ribosomal protein L9 [Hyphomicrobiales bacterium]NRB13005.1 50S ribosomal protein L9 [Hyphomicrobiales bacterium]
MKVILLERIAKLGKMGEIVNVKPGFARNFLLPQTKALRANDANMAKYEAEKEQLIALNADLMTSAEATSEQMQNYSVVAIRAASESGQLYGSVSTRDIAKLVTEAGISIKRSQVSLTSPIKAVGISTAMVALHPEVMIEISVNVARSTDEAERQAAGEDITVETFEDEYEFEAFDEDADDILGDIVETVNADEDEDKKSD